MHFLNDRISLVEYFYEGATGLFRETKRKIEAGEEPYGCPLVDPDESVDEPPFYDEWVRADASINMAGAACLS